MALVSSREPTSIKKSARIALFFGFVLAVLGLLFLASFIDGAEFTLFCLALTFGILVRNYRSVIKSSFNSAVQIAQEHVVKPSRVETSLTLDSLPIPLLKISEEGKVIQSNPAANDLLDLTGNEQIHLSDLIEGIGMSVSQWAALARKEGGRSKSEFVKSKRGDNERHLQVQIVTGESFGEQQCLCILQDATELKTLEAQFVQSQKMEAIGQLAGGIAHDFNNLLTAISGYCDLLMLRHEKGDADHSDLVQISSNANRAASLVGQLLAYSRKQTMQLRAVQANEVLTEITHLLNRLVGEKITLVFDREKNLPKAYVDSRQLEQVIMNLVVNARDAMPEGGEIKISSRKYDLTKDLRREDATMPAGKYISIAVEDNGFGIQPSNLKKIFEPFYSTKEVGEGTGLGLSMVYGIVKQSGGYIFAESKINQGTKFTLFLPVAPKSLKEAADPKSEKKKTSSVSGLRILLVEDEDPVRAFSIRALQGQGAFVMGASCGAEALEILNDNDDVFDVIVTDVVMPDMDGPTWLKKAKQDLKSAKIVFVSGYTQEAFADQWEHFDNAVFLSKPYSLKNLIETVGDSALTRH